MEGEGGRTGKSEEVRNKFDKLMLCTYINITPLSLCIKHQLKKEEEEIYRSKTSRVEVGEQGEGGE